MPRGQKFPVTSRQNTYCKDWTFNLNFNFNLIPITFAQRLLVKAGQLGYHERARRRSDAARARARANAARPR